MIKNTHIAIIDYGVGNLTSVANALDFIGLSYEIINKAKCIENATHLILPGVGSFKMGMDGLSRGGWIEPIKKFVLEEKKPILGICLGMQLFADVGFEDGQFPGLSIIPGTVEKITVKNLKLPHIGWNIVNIKPAKITINLPLDPYYYFVHSYHFLPKNKSIIVGTANYETPIASIIEMENIFGMQFHPEKSQENGMQILLNFSLIK
jgi:glutamine amidotransferase